MQVEQLFTAIAVIALIMAALYIKAIRKTIGLLLVILGGIVCLTFVGVVIGIPMILAGGLLLFL